MQKPEPNGGRDVQFCRGALADERRCHGQRNEPPRLATLGGDKGGERDRSSLYRCPCRRRPARCGRVSRRCSRRVSHFRRIAPGPARPRKRCSILAGVPCGPRPRCYPRVEHDPRGPVVGRGPAPRCDDFLDMGRMGTPSPSARRSKVRTAVGKRNLRPTAPNSAGRTTPNIPASHTVETRVPADRHAAQRRKNSACSPGPTRRVSDRLLRRPDLGRSCRGLSQVVSSQRTKVLRRPSPRWGLAPVRDQGQQRQSDEKQPDDNQQHLGHAAR